MFDFELSDELVLLKNSARSFARAELGPAMREAERQRGVSARVKSAATTMGLDRLALPEALGGTGLGCLARVIVNEELGAEDAGASLACDPCGPAIHPLLELVESELQRLVAPIFETAGRCVLVDGRDDGLTVDGQSVSGEVAWVPSDRVDLLVAIFADEITVVEHGIEVSPVHGAGLRAAGAGCLTLAQAPIAARLSDPHAVGRARAGARLYVASLMLGVMRQACEYSRAYARERQAFGKPIAHHQALAFLITDMHAAVEGLRLLIHDAAWRLDESESGETEAAQAFVEAVEVSRFVGPNAVQILGGHGFMRDHPVEKYMRDARALGLLLGGIDAAREEAGRAICRGSAPLELCSLEKL